MPWLDAAKISLDKIVAVGVTSPGALDTARGMVIEIAEHQWVLVLPLRAHRTARAGAAGTTLANDAGTAAVWGILGRGGAG